MPNLTHTLMEGWSSLLARGSSCFILQGIITSLTATKKGSYVSLGPLKGRIITALLMPDTFLKVGMLLEITVYCSIDFGVSAPALESVRLDLFLSVHISYLQQPIINISLMLCLWGEKRPEPSMVYRCSESYNYVDLL